ncbi:hypothetical protein PGT21_027460 [Puccinia graminis f. sp. tritici]|uniref:Uncharacterized protein n=2 Tax=Puccinia graminis f. sp. tritici TaxID=56615 RepID=A0A5B0M6B3_PUCGR|nr:hypothetical protein PGT21_027460 [Puccinia graminis f. sp. tritici]
MNWIFICCQKIQQFSKMHFYKSIVLFLLTAMVENIVASGPPPPPSSSGNGVQPRTDQVCQKVGGAQYCMTGVEQGRDKTQLIEAFVPQPGGKCTQRANLKLSGCCDVRKFTILSQTGDGSQFAIKAINLNSACKPVPK